MTGATRVPAVAVTTTSTRGNVQADLNLHNSRLGFLTPAERGIYPQELAGRTSGATLVDQTDALQGLINDCVSAGVILDTQQRYNTGGLDGLWGFYITKPLDLTGLCGLRGVLTIYCDGDRFTDSRGLGYAVHAANANFNGTTMVGNTTKGNLNFDWIEVRNINRRSGTIDGLMLTATRSTFNKLKGYGFNGHGVHLATAYDSTVGRVEVERCGNISKYGFAAANYRSVSGFADETNGWTIQSLLVHDCYEKAWIVSGSKMSLLNYHEEGTICTTVPTNPTPVEKRTPMGYLTSYFSSVGGYLGNGATLYSTSQSSIEQVMGIGYVGSASGNTYTNGTVIVMSGDPGPQGGNAQHIKCDLDLYILGNARTTVTRVNVGRNFYGRDEGQNSPVLGGTIANLVENSGHMSDVRIIAAGQPAPGALAVYTRCSFDNNFVNSRSRNVYRDCRFNKGLTTANDSRMDLIDCTFIGNLTIAGLIVAVVIRGGNVSGDLIIDAAMTGVWLLPAPPHIVGDVTGWRWPTATTFVGAITRNPNPNGVTSGSVVERQCNKGGWFDSIKIP